MQWFILECVYSYIVNFLIAFNVPQPDVKTLMIREKDIASAINAETFDSCKSASIEENRASNNQRIECSGKQEALLTLTV